MAAERPTFVAGDRPRSRDGVETAVFDGEAVLFVESTSMLHRLNATAGAVWLCCDGETTVAAMTDELAEVFVVAPGDIEAAVRDALAQLADEGLLEGFDGPLRLSTEPPVDRADDGRLVLVPEPDP